MEYQGPWTPEQNAIVDEIIDEILAEEKIQTVKRQYYCEASRTEHVEDLTLAKYYVLVIERFGRNEGEPAFKLCERCKDKLVKESIETNMYSVSICEII